MRPFCVVLLLAVLLGACSSGLTDGELAACATLLEWDSKFPITEGAPDPEAPDLGQADLALKTAAQTTGNERWIAAAESPGMARFMTAAAIQVARSMDASGQLDSDSVDVGLRHGYYGELCAEAGVDGFDGVSDEEFADRWGQAPGDSWPPQ